MIIGLFGHGKMGRAIEAIAIERGHSIGFIADLHQPAAPGKFEHCDVVIEFSVPEMAPSHIELCLLSGIPVVIGTTGWYHEFDRLKQLCLDKNGAMLPATNFSVGVNLFFALNSRLAKWMSKHPEYSAAIEEIHHVHKLDAPSGTAISLAEQIIAHHEQYDQWELSVENKKVPTSHLPIQSFRIDEVPGTHTVLYSSDIDDIEIKHQAHNRKGFAQGAVIAAEWIFNKKGVFSMADVLNFDQL